MRILAAAVLICAMASGAQARSPDVDVFFKRFQAGDCTGYQALADRALSPKGDLKDDAPFLAVTVGGCAARAGRLDIAERLGGQLAAARGLLGDAHLSILARRYGLIIADVPSGGPVAARVLDRVMAALPPDQAARLSLEETHALTLFAAHRAEEARALYASAVGMDGLHIQIDRRFEPLWKSPVGLEATHRIRPVEPEPPADADWLHRFAAAMRTGRDEDALAIARRQIEIETTEVEDNPRIYRERGWPARQWLVLNLIEIGRVEPALAALDAGAAYADADHARDYRRSALTALIPALLRADRAADARRLLDAEPAVGDQDPIEVVFVAYRNCLGGGGTTKTSSWTIALDCGASQDQVAALLLAAVSDPERRTGVLLGANLPPETPIMGHRDAEYRRERAALFARPEVKGAMEFYGRILPADLARALYR